MNRFVANPLAAEQMRRDPHFRFGMALIAHDVAEHVKSFAPEGTGAFHDSIDSDSDGEQTVVRSTDFAAHLIEFGSVNNPAYAPFRRAIATVGLRYEDHK